MSSPTLPGNASTKYRIHWHVLFTHFPVSLIMSSAGFMIAHVFTNVSCFELAGYITLISSAAILLPTTVSGWVDWKRKYKGAHTKTFIYKTRIAYAMLAVSIILIALRNIFLPAEHTIWHFVYAGGFVLLFIGALAEGYYGGRLNHR